MSKETSTAIKVVVILFAVIGVAVAAVLIVKKLKASKAEKEAALFDDIDDFYLDEDEEGCSCCDCDCEEVAE